MGAWQAFICAILFVAALVYTWTLQLGVYSEERDGLLDRRIDVSLNRQDDVNGRLDNLVEIADYIVIELGSVEFRDSFEFYCFHYHQRVKSPWV